ncbi:hypothetical protein HK405_014992 [Cladochytrium tenue]|nr:hypothetical protein HK405_014992 [Cladochytrium tenue]
MSAALTVPADYGYVRVRVILAGTAMILYTEVLAMQVVGARMKAKVPYPHLYASVETCAKDKDALMFNW